MNKKNNLILDKAIYSKDQDLFNFSHYAKQLQLLIQKTSSDSEPFTIGILGKWGEGKTSFLNLIKEKIDLFSKENKDDKGLLIYQFDPWRYNNENEILFDFYDGLGKLIKVKDKKFGNDISKKILRFSRYLKAVKLSGKVGIPLFADAKIQLEPDKIFEALGEDLGKTPITIESLKKEINDKLEISDYKVVVFVDNIDRLDKNEIYTALKLIKLNANFKNFVYIIALDEEQVSKAISSRYGSDKEDGILFLDKIINIPIRLPRVEARDIVLFFKNKIEEIFGSLDFLNNPKKREELEQIYEEITASTFNSPREVIKIINSFFISSFASGYKLNLRDLFWIEVLKVKNPLFYEYLKNYDISRSSLMFLSIIDFNDDYRGKEFPNGTRKFYEKTFENEFYIFKKIFPVWHNKQKYNRPKVEVLDADLKTSCLDHYGKYFSFNSNNENSNISIINFLKNLKKDIDDKEIVEIILKLFKEDKDGSAIFQFENLIKTIENDYYKLFNLILNNTSIIPIGKKDIFGKNNRIRIIEIIGNRLNSDDSFFSNYNKSNTFLKIENLDIEELCHFTRKFKNNSDFRKQLETTIVEKAQKTIIENSSTIFYHKPEQVYNKMIMECWRNLDKKTFNNYIYNNITSISHVELLIQNFAPYWNDSFFGALDIDNYDYLKRILEVDEIFYLIQDHDKKLVERHNESYNIINDKDEFTPPENLKLFIYWYLKDKEDQDNFNKQNPKIRIF